MIRAARPLIPLLLLAGSALAAVGLGSDPRETGRTYTAWFLGGELEQIWDHLSPDMRELFKDQAGLRSFQEGILENYGAEKSLVRERVHPEGDWHEYMRVLKGEASDVPLSFRWTFDGEGTIVGLYVRPERGGKPPGPVPTRFGDYRTKTPLRLPFEGEWFVVWGGHTQEQNYHVINRGQRFAYDILVKKDGRSHDGDGTKLEDYHAYGLPILAPGEGVVVEATDDMDDLTPGEMDPSRPLGNHVIIDHGNGEFSFLCHFRRGSVAVKAGDRVQVGQRLGLCGNSGNTSEPHLHYHLQNTGVFDRGEGLPAQFESYYADGKPVARGEPVRGQVIRPREPDEPEPR